MPLFSSWLFSFNSSLRRMLSRLTLGRTLITLCVLTVLVIVLDNLYPPPLARFLEQRSAQLILATDGTPLRAFPDARGVWRYAVRTQDIAPAYLQLLLNYEDRAYFRHPGVNPVALSRALAQALWYRRPISGGSTITMQVARIIENIPHTARGKLTQMARAFQLERRLSKAEILAIYLQYAPYGGTIEGVETAARAYLGKSSHDLSDAEAALLVVLPQRPSALRPDRAPAAATAARNKVLQRMATLGVWPSARVQDAKLEQVFAKRLRTPMLAPLLAQRLHEAHPDAAQIHTGIEARWQQMAQARVASHIKRFAPATSAAVLIVDNHTMLARAYVGSALFGDAKSYGHIDMVRASRSPGSTLKPALYAMALDAGLIHSESLLIDAPQDFSGYRPANFSESFNGPIAAAAALRLSLNIPAVDLLDRLGPGKFYAALDNAGLRLAIPDGGAPNLSLILGGAGARLEELVSVHAALARKGFAARVRFSTLSDAGGAPENRVLMSEGAAWITYQMLSEAGRLGVADSAIFDHGNRRRIAFKTGTSFGFRDAWALGTTPNVTIGVWIGRPDGTPNPGSFGAVSALPLLFELFDGLAQSSLGSESGPPPSVTQADICWPLGLRFDTAHAALCHKKMRAYLLDDTAPATLPERGAKLWQSGLTEYFSDPDTGLRRNASCLNATVRVATIARWPAMSYPWLSPRIRQRASLPALSPDCSRDAMRPEALVIEGILDGATLKAPSNRSGAQQRVPIGLRVLGSEGAVSWLLDGALLKGASDATMHAAGTLTIPMPAAGKHRLVVLDREGRYAAVNFQVIL
jgi:penicillin-binding protein 1C